MPTIPAEFPDIAYYMERVRKLEEANDRLREQSAEHTESRGMMGAQIRDLEAKLAAATACISEITLSRDHACGYVAALEVALAHVIDASDYDPEVCPECGDAARILEELFARRVKETTK